MAICVVAVSPNFVSYNSLLPACPHRCISPHLPVLTINTLVHKGEQYSWLLWIIIIVHPPKKIPLEGQKYDVWICMGYMVIPCHPTITRDSLSSVSYLFMRNDHPLWWKVKGQTCTPSPESSDPWRKQIAFGQYIDVWPRKAAGFGTCILKGTMEHYGTWPWEISPLMIVFLERHPEIVGQGDCPFHCMSMFEYPRGPRAVWIFVSRNCRQIWDTTHDIGHMFTDVHRPLLLSEACQETYCVPGLTHCSNSLVFVGGTSQFRTCFRLRDPHSSKFTMAVTADRASVETQSLGSEVMSWWVKWC